MGDPPWASMPKSSKMVSWMIWEYSTTIFGTIHLVEN